MESLLGVSTAYPSLRLFDIDVSPKEIVHIYTLYLLELTRTCGAQSQGVAGMDNQIGSHTFTVLIVMFSSLIGFWMLVTRAYIVSPWNSIPYFSYRSFIH